MGVFEPTKDTGQRFGLAPMLQKRLQVAASRKRKRRGREDQSDGSDSDSDSDSGSDVEMALIQDQLQHFESYERARDVKTEEEMQLMRSTFSSLEYPNGADGNKAVVNLSVWTDLFNKEVRKAWKEKTATKDELRLKMPAQISRAYEQMGKTLMVQKLLDQNPLTLAKLKACQHYLKTNPKGFKIPDFADPFAERERERAAATTARVRGTTRKGASLVSWNYKFPKKS